jgi:Zn-dependent M28 family amino/carboxypeptidase
MRRRSRVVAAGLLAVAMVGCGRTGGPQASPAATPSTPSSEFATGLAAKLTTDAMMAHLTKLQDIANANGGNRALGSPGYAASADYVAKTLRDKGFDVATNDFEVKLPFSDEPVLTVGGQTVKAAALKFTVGAPGEGVSAPLVPARSDDTPGCTADDYDGRGVSGAIVLVDRGSCPFSDKEAAAAERGAVALIVANNVEGDELPGGTLGEQTDVKIPAIGISKADGVRLRANPGTSATIKLNAGVRVERTHNVIAQTKTGSTHDVVMAGAHLDSVPEGPGINDNGSGAAAVLETAVQLGSSPDVRNAVRFGFWGAEEEGLVGSSNYVKTLDVEALKDIALYLNFDMLGSPNPGYFTYDGDQSAPPNSRVPRVPEGSAGIERTLAAYLKSAGKTPQDTDFDGRSDYDGFTQAGVPAGGLFSGAEEKMTEDQAKLWGGAANQPFDPNYHKPTDTLDHIDRTSLEIQGRGVAFAVGLYAQDEAGRNGVPVREDRTRHTASAS